MSGIDRITGKAIDGWPHVVQSLAVILTTPRRSRVMRREFGSDLPRLVDAPISPVTMIDFFAATARGIKDHEPRFRVTRMGVQEATAGGSLTLALEGVYFPRGHLGDFSVSQPKSASVPL